MTWKTKRKGSARVHMHPDAKDGCAVVENHHGVRFKGSWYGSVEEARTKALDRGNHSA